MLYMVAPPGSHLVAKDQGNTSQATNLVDGEAVDVEVSFRGDVDAREALVVGDLQRGEGLVVVHVEQVDRQVQVAAKDEGHAGRHQHPVVCQHAQIVRRPLCARGTKPLIPACLHGKGAARNENYTGIVQQHGHRNG